jgi:DNA helicase-2/ATP-dependent DNA helicase PcrA
MPLDKSDWDYEKSRLKKVYDEIENQLAERREGISGYRRDIVRLRRSMWENEAHNWLSGDMDAAANIKQYRDMLDSENRKYLQSRQILKQLEKMAQSPYFARVDFKEEGMEDVEQIYIGIASLFDRENNDILICDWRAPISSIFYDYELGFAKYPSHEGVIRGHISLKRQFRITRSHIDYMFDSSIKIDDEILQEILSKNVDDKMRTIVTTIQKEQNRIIRNEENDLLIVQGAAGSGKTSIALHRVAYLLYKYRDQKITAQNIVIFSPNQLFNDYISNVLPELGEENMQQTTFMEYAKKRLGSGLKLEDMNDQMEFMLTCQDNKEYGARAMGIRYKASVDFLKLVKQYARYLEEEGTVFKDITHRGQLIISKEELTKLFRQEYSYLPVIRRLAKIKSRVLRLIKPFWERRLKELQKELMGSSEYGQKVKAYSRLMVFREFKPIRHRLENMTSLDVYSTYSRLFSDRELFNNVSKGTLCPEGIDIICRDTLSRLERNYVGYEDVAPLLFLKGIMEGVPNMDNIRHVVIDEAQDYSPTQYEIFRQLFRYSRLTLLGDLNQTIHPYLNISRYEILPEILGSKKPALLTLSKTYRSTREIVEFSRAMLLTRSAIEPIQRSGDKPRVVKLPSYNDIFINLAKDIHSLLKEDVQSVAVICKTAAESLKVYNELKTKAQIHLLTKEDDQFISGIVVIPSYLAKGLEFDAVLVVDASMEKYGREEERKLLYTACTRALHKLILYYSGSPSPFLPMADKSLYQSVCITGKATNDI